MMLELKLGTTKFYLRSDLLTVFTAASNEGGCINVADARKLRDWLVAFTPTRHPIAVYKNYKFGALKWLNLLSTGMVNLTPPWLYVKLPGGELSSQ
jgi:hypothetical protein